MNAREDANSRTGTGALGRGLETLMGEQDAHAMPPSAQDGGRPASLEGAAAEGPDARPALARDEGTGGHADASSRTPAGGASDRPLAHDVATVGGLIAGGAMGAVAVAAFVLLGVKAVLSMQPRGLF